MHVRPSCFLYVCPSAEFVKQVSHYGMKGRFRMVFILEGQNRQTPGGKGGSPIGMGAETRQTGYLLGASRWRQSNPKRRKLVPRWYTRVESPACHPIRLLRQQEAMQSPGSSKKSKGSTGLTQVLSPPSASALDRDTGGGPRIGVLPALFQHPADDAFEVVAQHGRISEPPSLHQRPPRGVPRDLHNLGRELLESLRRAVGRGFPSAQPLLHTLGHSGQASTSSKDATAVAGSTSSTPRTRHRLSRHGDKCPSLIAWMAKRTSGGVKPNRVQIRGRVGARSPERAAFDLKALTTSGWSSARAATYPDSRVWFRSGSGTSLSA